MCTEGSWRSSGRGALVTLAGTTEAARAARDAKTAGELPKSPRVAIVHYWFAGSGGAERVIGVLAEMFHQADFYALVAADRGVPAALRGRSLATSFVGRIPGAKRWHRHFLPLYPFTLEQFDLSDYDLVISSESGPAKGVITSPRTCHICYCHTPMRYLWDMYHEYRKTMNPLTRGLFSLTAHYARLWDFSAAARVDCFVANSRHVAGRIWKYYRRESTIIYPPVDVSAGYISSRTEDYYLVVSRLVPYKRVDLAIEACNRLGRPLRVVGSGPEYKRLRKMAGPSVEFLGKLDEPSLCESYARCRALLFPAEEDFGIVPVEAQSFGRPVIAYGRGGALETVIGLPPGGNGESATGILFHEQSQEALGEAIAAFEAAEASFRPHFIRAQAQPFSVERFKEEFTKFTSDRLAEFQGAASAGREGQDRAGLFPRAARAMGEGS
jgi:glycosyltransferase involved in cell wall biosynthesis